MKKVIEENYRDWQITVTGEHNKCSNFSFSIVDPSGSSQEVKMGGENAERALERAKEMVDSEIAFAAGE